MLCLSRGPPQSHGIYYDKGIMYKNWKGLVIRRVYNLIVAAVKVEILLELLLPRLEWSCDTEIDDSSLSTKREDNISRRLSFMKEHYMRLYQVRSRVFLHGFTDFELIARICNSRICFTHSANRSGRVLHTCFRKL
jgi:hypothetical protein